ncbi:hypothetical protein [Alteromonas sp. a30]|uniref:hypothetical protein n=1 Tax=Alteromonas sp. a30 TaxID=2730917 RepID=UPI00227EF061|nr:hypothetical protein [Alteromonas sp. a30]MCY7295091.1 hypothetical protein [Alteromonas sp. a30]
MDTQKSLQQNLEAVKRLSKTFKKFVGSAEPLLDKLTQITSQATDVTQLAPHADSSSITVQTQNNIGNPSRRDIVESSPHSGPEQVAAEVTQSPAVAERSQDPNLNRLPEILAVATRIESLIANHLNSALVNVNGAAENADRPINLAIRNTLENTALLDTQATLNTDTAVTPNSSATLEPGESNLTAALTQLPQVQSAVNSFSQLQQVLTQVESTLGVSITSKMAELAQSQLPFIGQFDEWAQQNPELAQGLSDVANGLMNNVPLMDAISPLAQQLADVPVVNQINEWAQQNPVLAQSLEDVAVGVLNNASVMDTLGPAFDQVTGTSIVAQTQQWAQENPALAQGLQDITWGMLENSKAMSIINPLMGTFSDVPILGKITSWAQGNSTLTQSIQETTAGLIENINPIERLSPLMNGFSFIGEKSAGGLAKLGQFATPLVSILGRVTSVFTGLNIAMLANPMVLIIAGIVALIAVIGLLIYKYFEPLKAAFVGLWDGFIEGIEPLLKAFEPIKALFANLGDVFNAFKELIFSAIGAAFDFVVGKVKAMMDGIANIGNTVVGFFSGLFGGEDEEDSEAETEAEQETVYTRKVRIENKVKQAAPLAVSQSTIVPQTLPASDTAEANTFSQQINRQTQTNAVNVAGADNQAQPVNNVFSNPSQLNTTSSRRAVSVGDVNISVNASPEQSSTDIAEKVKAIFENMMMDMQREQRGALFDG